MGDETIPAGPVRFGRWQSGGLNAAGFLVLLYVAALAFQLTPLGVVFQAGMFFSLPVMALVWLEGASAGGVALWAATVLPYPLIGLLLGLLRPLERPLFWRAVAQMSIRLAATMAVLVAPGLVFFFGSKAH